MNALLALTLATELLLGASGAPLGPDAHASIGTQTSESLALEAREARRAGRLLTAAWATEQALHTPPVSPIAAAEAERLGWQVSAAADSGTGPSPWPWWLIGAAAWLALLAAAWALQDRVGLVALGVGLVVSLVVMPDGVVERPVLPDALAQPLGDGLCADQRVFWEDGHLLLTARCDGQATRWRVDRLGTGQGVVKTAHHELGGGASLRGSETARTLEARLVTAIGAAEAGGYRVDAEEAWTQPRLARWAGADADTRALLQVSAGAVSSALVVILLGLFFLLRSLASAVDSRLLKWLLGALCVAVIAHLLVDGRMRMMYSGYHLTQLLIDGQIPRYGPGAIWFYGPALWLDGGHHVVTQVLNRLYGLGCCAAVVVLAWVWFDRRTAAVTAGLVCALPFLWFAHSCESIHVAPTLAVLVAVGLLCHPTVRSPVGAALALVAAALTRPEIAAVVFMIPVWLWFVTRSIATSAEPTSKRWPWMVALAAGYLVVGWHMGEILSVSDRLMDQGAVASPGRWLERGWYAMGLGGVFMSPGYLPSVFLPLALFSAAHSRTRRVALPTVLLGIVWLGSAGVDYAYVSLIRLQLPAVFLWIPLIAAGALTLYEGRWGRSVAVGLAVLFVAGGAWSAEALAQRTVEDHEDVLWREVDALLPEQIDQQPLPACVVTHMYGDETESRKTPRFIPRYLFGDAVSLHPLHALQTVASSCRGAVYFLRGTRCYAQMRAYGAPPPPEGTDYCTRVPPADRLETVFERDVPNVSVLTYPMYPEGETLRLGLYRVRR